MRQTDKPTPKQHPLAFLAGGGEMGQRMRAFDWSKTPVGPLESWPQSLKTAVRIMLTSRQPFWIGWGEQLIKLYNDAYLPIIGGKHPRALGQPASVVWREIWGDIAPLLATAMTGNEGTYVESQLLIMERNGYPEETHYTYSYSPVPGDDGGTGGIICANTDDTQRVIGERQLALLRELAARTADARTIAEACALSAAGLGTNPYDLPFALIYLVDPERGRVALAGASGLGAGHAAAPEALALDADSVWPFAEVVRARQACLVGDLGDRVGVLPTGTWKQPPHQAVAVPIAPSGRTGKAGILVAGLNPFRLFDDNYRRFLDLVSAQIAAGIANAQAYEEERKRSEALAELDRAKTAFFSNVSHEFRTPLTLMLGPVEDLLARSHTDLTPAAADQLEVVNRNGLRLLRLVNTLLDFSRIEAGRVRAAYQPTDLAAFTADLASVFRSACERAGLRLVVDCTPLGDPAFVDRDMWEKVVLNLLSNAFKFTLAGEIAVTLRQVPSPLSPVLGGEGLGVRGLLPPLSPGVPGERGEWPNCGCGTPARASPPRRCPASSSGSTGSRTHGVAPTRVRASDWRSSTSWSSCTAAPSPPRVWSVTARRLPCPSHWGRPTCRPTRSARAAPPLRPGRGPAPTSRRRCGGSPQKVTR
jgi:signal transduction histidine kinase